jgi:nicotinamidase/pyrazinamidase
MFTDIGFQRVVYTRDRHPLDHVSFQTQGGAWPVHCVDESAGFAFHPELPLAPGCIILDQGTDPHVDNFDGFHDSSLAEQLRSEGIRRVVVAGLATEYAVNATALGSLREGFETWVAVDASAGLDRQPGDIDRALLALMAEGANLCWAGSAATLVVKQPHPSALIVVNFQNDFCPGGSIGIAGATQALAHLRPLINLARPARPSLFSRLRQSATRTRTI